MSVLSSSSGKTRERVRVHTQLGNFPLLADAVIVRMTRTKEGFRWALRFDRMDDTTRANLEGFVRQQLANAARVRQAQLYAARMKSTPLPGATPAPAWPTPTPTPAPVLTPPPSSVPTPLPDPGASVRSPPTDAAPAGSVPLEIELPNLVAPPSVARPQSARTAPPPYSPYGGQSGGAQAQNEQLAALGEEPVVSSQPATPVPPRPAAPTTAPAEPLDAAAPAFDPAVAAADEAELLLGAPSDEPIAVAPTAAVASRPAAPATPKAEPAPAAPPAQTVWELDAEALDDEVSFAAVLAEADQLAAETSDAPAPARTGDTVLLSPEDTAAPGLVSNPVEPDSALVNEGPSTVQPGAAPRHDTLAAEPSLRQPAYDQARPAEAAPVFGEAVEAFEDVVGDVVADVVADDVSDGISLASVEQQPGPSTTPAPALVGAPFDLSGDDDDETLPVSGEPAATAVEAPAPKPPPARAAPTAPAPVRPPTPTQDFGGLPFDAGPPVQSPPTAAFGAELEITDHDLDLLPAASGPTGDEGLAAGDAPRPAGGDVAAAQDAPAASPAPAVTAAAPSAPAPSTPRAPAPPVYPDVVAPYDPYGPGAAPSAKPVSAAMAKHPDIGSAPRTIGELPPAVEGLYTPASNPSLGAAGDSGVYQSASFEPFPSPTEKGLYGGESTLSFEDRRDDPRQRLAKLQVKVAPKVEPDDDSSMYLGDIEGATSGLTPTHAKMLRTDEDLSGSPFVDTPIPDSDMPTSVHSPQAGSGAPDSVLAAMPTGPVDVGISDYTPAPYDPADSGIGAPVGVHAERPLEALSTAPGFAVVPDYEAPPEPSGESDNPLMRPAQSGQTIVASTELLGLGAPPDPSSRAPAEAPAAPSDFEVLPSFSAGADQPSAFTVVAGFEDMASSTMVATAAQVDAWRRAEAAAPRTAFDDEANTSYFTPAPGSLAPIMPPDVESIGGVDDPETVVVGGAALTGGLDDAELTAMRVHPGGVASPAGAGVGAGFELNPRGPAQPLQPAAEPPAPVGPGPSARRGTRREQGGRPAPPPATAQRRPPPPQPPRGRGPAVLGSGRVGTPCAPGPAEPVSEQAPTGPHATVPLEAPTGRHVAIPIEAAPSAAPPVAPSPPSSRRSLVEDALQQLKRRTDAKRKDKQVGPAEEAKPADAKRNPKPKPRPTTAKPAAASKHRRRTLGKAEVSDPRIAELYQAALTDLSGKKDPP